MMRVEKLQPDMDICYQYEDQLPENIPDEMFDAMFAVSIIDFVRLYPFINTPNGVVFLGDRTVSET